MSVSIHRTTSADFELVYPILLSFKSPHQKDDWRRIFNYKWNPKDYVGYHLKNSNNQIVGFMGMIFSKRKINGENFNFCNVTSLIVKNKYRAYTSLFLFKLKRLDNHIITGLSPIIESYQLFKKIGYKDLETEYFAIPSINKFIGKIKIHLYNQNLHKRKDLDLRIYEDHKELNLKSLEFEFKNNICVIFYREIYQKHFGITFKKLMIFHISEIKTFSTNIHYVLGEFFKRYGIFSMIYIDKRFCPKLKGLFFRKKISPPRIYLLNNVKCEPELIDELYSEHILL